MVYSLKFTGDNIPTGSAGANRFWMIYVRPTYRDDKPLIEHEKTHVRHFWRNPFKHVWKYGRDKDYTLACEVEAYRCQLTFCNEWDKEINRQKFAERIATKYGINITVEDAYKLL